MIAVNDEAAPAFFCLSLSLFRQGEILHCVQTVVEPVETMTVSGVCHSERSEESQILHCLYITAGFLRVD